MIDNWLTEDDRIDVPKLFERMGYERVRTEKQYHIYKRNSDVNVVVLTDKGYIYYKVQRPEVKLTASNLITEYVSKMEGTTKETIWDKVNDYYQKVLKDEVFIMEQGPEISGLKKVAFDFNHFHSYSHDFVSRDGLYSDVQNLSPFKNRIFEDAEGKVLFPLFNLQNENCGYFLDNGKSIRSYEDSSLKNSLWFSNIPKTIEWLVVFKDPREALAFHRKFKLKNAVYLALGEINFETAKILFQIRESAKVKKIILSFTGNRKIEGYLRDLNFISFMNESNFRFTLKQKNLLLQFQPGEEKSFLKFFNSTKTFNQGLAKSFLKYNKILNQHKINEQSILVSKKEDAVQVKIPLEVNAIKFFVWSYYKNYLYKTIDILKPVQPNWHLEWEAEESLSLKRKEVQLEDYRIAL